MFNSGIKSNERCNGLVPPALTKPKSMGQTNFIRLAKPALNIIEKYNNVETSAIFGGNYHDFYKTTAIEPKIKIEMDDFDIESKITAHSIIGLSDGDVKTHKLAAIVPTAADRATHHETLQRIEAESDANHYQSFWFSAGLEKFKMEDRSREERIEITRHECTRHLQQIVRSQIGRRRRRSPIAAEVPRVEPKARNRHQSGYDRLVAPAFCKMPACVKQALPCAHHCALHIMHNLDQVLFGHCTAKFADNTQCSRPVFDIAHELPLCPEHARKRDNYQMHQEAKPKKLRKKVKPSAMIRPQKRSKKKRKVVKMMERFEGDEEQEEMVPMIGTECEIIEEEVVVEEEVMEEDMHMVVDQVLGLNESGLEQVLAHQANNLLEETDISTVLSTIQVDEFSDFFAVNRNGEYEPSREEAEELEKALAAVDNDVKSLEKLSQSQGLLDSLDEQSLAESLVQIPDIFHNGYSGASVTCGDSMVTQTASFLLPVEPQSHS